MTKGTTGYRPWLAGVAVALVTMVAMSFVATLGLPAHAATATLRALAEAKGRYFGTALTFGDLNAGTETTIAGTQFDMVTPGNEMKWDTTEPSNGTFNFGPGDQIVSFAVAHGMRVRGHNLVWHSQLPSWVSSLPASQVQGAMETHITTEVSHYRGKIYAWDVVNEPFNDNGTLRQDAFSNAMGSGYIADALRTAHAADPTAKLYLNDFNIEGENAKSNAMFTLAQQLLAQGVPLGGIGFESHFILGQVPADMQANLQRFANLGLDVAVTELDDRIQLPATATNLQQQASDFGRVVSACLAVTRCVGVTQWGVDDAHSWIPGAFPGFGAATMYDNSDQPKPAFNSVVSTLGGSTANTDTGPVHAVGAGKCLDVPNASTTPGVQLQIWDCSGLANQTWTLTAAGQLTVFSGASQLCLDAFANQTTPGTKVETWTCNGGTNQQWRVNANGTITGVQSGLCLDVVGASTVDGALIQLWTCNGGSNQQWALG